MIFRPLDGGGLTYAVSVLSQKITEKFNALAKVARSGNYIDLTNLPSIPPAVAVKGNAESKYRTGDVNITKENIGLANTEDKSSETIRSEITSENVANALGYTPMNEDLDTYVEKESPTGSEKVIVNDSGEVKQVEMSKVKPAVMKGATETSPGLSGLVPAPGVRKMNYNLTGSGEFLDNGIIRLDKKITGSGWYRVARVENDNNFGGYITPFILNFGKSFSNSIDESGVVACSMSGNYADWTCLSRIIRNASKKITGIRISKKSHNAYLEFYYNDTTSNYVSIIVIAQTSMSSDFGRFWLPVDFEPAEADETVVSEYTIPDKDDISTSKSLAMFEEIPEGADLHNTIYTIPGNYSCSTNSKANSLLNCPLNSAFTLDVSKGVGEIDNIIIQTFFDYLGTKIVKVVYVSGSGWRQPSFFYSAQGTPPANKLWGTDANGNVGWIDPP